VPFEEDVPVESVEPAEPDALFSLPELESEVPAELSLRSVFPSTWLSALLASLSACLPSLLALLSAAFPVFA
jgi:hypothetical protein